MTIAQKVIDKCGGVQKTAALVGNTPSMIYRWTYDKDKGGTGGLVPRAAQERLLEAAGAGLINITPNDFFADTSVAP